MLRQLKNVKNAYSELGHLRDKARAAGLETRAARVAVAETATRGVDVTRAMVAISIGRRRWIGRRRNVLCAPLGGRHERIA